MPSSRAPNPTSHVDSVKRRERLLKRWQALKTERSSWETRWRDISDFQRPGSLRLNASDTNKGGRRDQHIIDNTALFAQRTLAAGMMAGVTSPARPWFRLSLRDQDLMGFAPVKEWLHQASDLILAIFAQGNHYRALHNMYSELGLFGTSAAFLMPDFDDVSRLYPTPVGEYVLAANYRGEVDTIIREFRMTSGQLATQFGRGKVSRSVRNLIDRNDLDVWVPVLHVVQPNPDFSASSRASPLSKHKAFSSIYIEIGADHHEFLRESGFDTFPALTPRWEVIGNDVYGQSPGAECLGDVKQLQHQQLRKAQAIDYQVNPPLQVPTAIKEHARARLPGGIFHVDVTAQNAGVRSAFEVNLDLQALLADIYDVRERINSAYYADLFLMLANDTRSGITATEVMERHEEKMLMLGPVLERLHNEMLSPLIVSTFQRCLEVQILPPPPEEIQGMPFEVEFVSTLAQAQKAVTSGNIDQVVARIGQVAGLDPTIMDKLNSDQLVDDLADMYGINPKLINAPEQVAQIRQQRAEQQQAQQMVGGMQPAADAMRKMGEIDTRNLRQVQDLFQGYSA